MNKRLLAAAVATAFAAPAIAQNVTVYGVIDTGVQAYDTGASSVTRASSGIMTSERFGLTGSEDLGGGLKAIFKLEAGLNTSSGVAGTQTTAANYTATLFNRAASVGLTGSFGTVKIGLDTLNATDSDAYVSQSGNMGLNPSIGATGDGLGDKIAQVVIYETPSFNGLSVQVGYSNNTSSATADAATSYTGVAARYESGNLKATIGQTTQDGAGVAKKDLTSYGLAYNFGIASASISGYNTDGNTADDNTVKGTVATVAVPLGNGLTAYGNMARASSQASSTNKGSGMSVAIAKAMSKRTTVYGYYVSTNQNSAGTFRMTGTTTPGTAGVDTGAVGAGIRHTF